MSSFSCLFKRTLFSILLLQTSFISAVTLTGMVKDQLGNVIVGANVNVFKVEGNNFTSYGGLITIDETGQYTVDVDPGDYVVRAYFDAENVTLPGAPDHAFLTTADFNVASDTTHDITFDFVILSGKVTTEEGLPLSGIRIETSKSWNGPEIGSAGKLSQWNVIHQNNSVVTADDGKYTMLLYKTGHCVASGHYLNSSDCLYDLQFIPHNISGLTTYTEHDYVINNNQSLNVSLSFKDPEPANFVSEPIITNISDTSAVVNWTTDKPSTSEVSVSNFGEFNDSTLKRTHQVVLTGLTASTSYQLSISSTDADQNVSGIFQKQFATKASQDSSAPHFTQQPTITLLTETEVKFEFCANEPVTAEIQFDNSLYHLTSPGLCHVFSATELVSNTSYTAHVSILDINNNGPSYVSPLVFKTLSEADEQAPFLTFGPVVTDVDDTSARLVWKTNEPTTTAISIQSDNQFRQIYDETLVSEHQVLLNLLQPQTVYQVSVSATDGAGNGPVIFDSIEFVTQAQPDTTEPLLLGQPRIKEVGSNYVIIEWQTDEATVGYVKLGSNGGNLEHSKVSDELNVKHQVTFYDLGEDSYYDFQVVSKDASNNETQSSVLTFKTLNKQIDVLEFTSPTVVVGLTHHSVSVEWSTNQQVTLNLICTKAGHRAEVNRTHFTAQDIISLAGLEPSSTYRCSLYASNSIGFIAQSTFEITTLGLPDTTAPVCEAEEVIGHATYAELQWSASELVNATVKYKTTNSDEWRYVNPQLGKSGLIVVNQLSEQTDYNYQLLLTDLAGNSTACSQGEFNSGSVTQPELTLSPEIRNVSISQAELHWNTNVVTTGQVILGLSSDSLVAFGASNKMQNLHQLDLTQLQPETEYFVQVIATDSANQVITSNILSFTTLAVPLGEPLVLTGPEVKFITDTSAVVFWETNRPTNATLTLNNDDHYHNGELSQYHQMSLVELSPATTYEVTIGSTDQWGQAVNGNTSFTTLAGDNEAPWYVEGPVIDQVDVDRFVVSFCANEIVNGHITVNGTIHPLNEAAVCHEVTISGLSANTQYAVQASITDLAGNGPTLSEILYITTLEFIDLEAPLILEGPFVIEITDTTAIVIWTTNEPATSVVNLSGAGTSIRLEEDDLVREHRVLLTGLMPETMYEVIVESSDWAGNGPTVSDPVYFETLGYGDGSAPLIIFGPVIEDITTNSAKVLWTTNEASSTLVRYGTSENQLDLIAECPCVVSEHILSLVGLQPATTYYVQAESVDLAGNKVISKIVEFTTLVNGVILPIITDGPNLLALSDTQLTIGWETNIYTDSRLKCESTGSYETIELIPVISHQLTLTGLSPSTNYECEVLSRDTFGNEASATITITTEAMPDVVLPFCTSDVSVIGMGDKADVTWSTSELSTAVLSAQTCSTCPVIRAYVYDANDQHVAQLKGLSPETDYQYQIQLTDLAGNQNNCDGGTFNSGIIQINPCQFTLAPVVTDITQTTANVNWTTDVASTAILYYGVDPTSLDQQISISQLMTKHKVHLANLNSGETYYVQVKAFNSNGDETLSNIVAFTTLHVVMDFDSDGIINSQDNCPYIPNTDQLDTDNNGIGDVCDDSSIPVEPIKPKLLGKVTAEGSPVEGAIVSIFDASLEPVDTTVTAADGSYNFPGLEPAKYFITATPPSSTGFAATPLESVTLNSGDLVHWITLIADAHILSGQIIDSLNRPIDGIHVSLHLQTTGNQIGDRMITDENGFFEFAVAPGTYQIRPIIDLSQMIQASNYPVPDFATVNYMQSNIVVEDDHQVTMQMPFAILTAVVRDSANQLVPGVRVQIDHELQDGNQLYNLSSQGLMNQTYAVTDANGQFSIALFTDQQIDLHLVPPSNRTDLAVTTMSNYSISNDVTDNFILADGVTLSGNVRDSHGRPIDHVMLTLFKQDSETVIGNSFYTDGNGHYQRQVEDGNYRVKVQMNSHGNVSQVPNLKSSYPLPDFASVIYASENILVSGSTSADIDIPMAILSGHIEDGANNPVADVKIQISHVFNHADKDFYMENRGESADSYAVSDNNGEFRIALFTGQPTDILFKVPTSIRDYADTKITGYTISADATDSFSLSQAVTLSGVLRDNEGNVLDNTYISLHDQFNHQLVDRPTVTNGSGQFDFRVSSGTYKVRPYLQPTTVLDDNTYTATYLMPDYAAVHYMNENTVVTANQSIEVELPLSQLTGKALDMNGVPVPDVKVRIDHQATEEGIAYYLENTGDEVQSNAISDSNGDFGFGVFLHQDIDFVVTPTQQSGFALTNVTHQFSQNATEHIFLPHANEHEAVVIAGPIVTQISTTSAVVHWYTDKPTTGIASCNGNNYQTSEYKTQHSQVIENLSPNTVYTVSVTSTDKEGRNTETKTAQFKTLNTVDSIAAQCVVGPEVKHIDNSGFEYTFCADEPVIGNISLGSQVISLSDYSSCHHYEFTNLSPNQPYVVDLDLFDKAGNQTTNCAQLEVVTRPSPDTQPPTIILTPYVIDISATEATVIWHTDEPATSGVSYNDGENYHVVTEENYVTEHSVVLTDLTPETEYQLSVSSTDVHGNGPVVSEPITFTTLNLPDTEAPCLVGKPMIQNITHQHVVVRWRTCESATTVVMIGTTPDNLDRIETRNGMRIPHNVAITGLIPETQYYFRVQSADAAGNVMTSDLVSFTTKVVGHQGQPHFMTSLMLEDTSAESISMSWVTDVNADTRLICQSVNGTYEVNESKRVKKHLVTLFGLEAGTDYQCTAMSTDHHGYTSSEDYEQTVTTDSLVTSVQKSTRTKAEGMSPKSSDSSAPSVLTQLITGYGESAIIQLETDEVSNAVIRLRQSGQQIWQSVSSTEIDYSHLVVLANLTTSTAYEWQYQVSDLFGNVEMSAIMNFNSGSLSNLSDIQFVQHASVSDVEYNRATISWETSDAALVQIRYGLDQNNLTFADGIYQWSLAQAATLVGLSPGTTYFVQLVAFDPLGNEYLGTVNQFTTVNVSTTEDTDGDGMPDYWELEHGYNIHNPEDANLDEDNDGLTSREEFLAGTSPDNEDSDSDGMPDGWEIDHGSDPLVADANQDANSNGITNLQEYNSAADTVAPVISLTGVVDINSTGVLTEIPSDLVTVTDNVDTNVEAIIVGESYLATGRYQVIWQAEDSAGNSSQVSQIVNVLPQLNYRRTLTSAEGATETIALRLSGEAAEYPVRIQLTFSGNASENDFQVDNRLLEITQGTEIEYELNIVSDDVTEGMEELQIQYEILDNAWSDVTQPQIISIQESNVAPEVSLQMIQNGQLVTTVYKDQGMVDITAFVREPNTTDQINYQWLVSPDLIDTNSNEHKFSFDPSGLSQSQYSLEVMVEDTGSPAMSDRMNLIIPIREVAPNLSGADSDGDGIADNVEGFGDSDADGIPDYLDTMDGSNHIQQSVNDPIGYYAVQTSSSLEISLGETALTGSDTGVELSESSWEESELYQNHGEDTDTSHVGQLINFKVGRLDQAGGSILVVIPQRQPIPEDAIYRKILSSGWQDFEIDQKNKVYSAQGVAGICPGVESNEYTEGLQVGYYCVMLMIEDGGPNDFDGVVNRSVSDPGSVSTLHMAPTVSINSMASVTEGSTINLTANVTDNGNQIVSYLWEQTSGPSVTITNADQLNASVSNSPVGTLGFRLTIQDQRGRTAVASVSVVVNASAPPPTTNTGNSSSSGGGGSIDYWIVVVFLLLSVIRLRHSKCPCTARIRNTVY